MLRGAGIVVALIVLAACGGSSPVVRASPSLPAEQASWTQDLSFSGDISGHMTSIVPDTASLESACTGAKPRPGQTWADKFYGSIDTTGEVWGIDIVIQNYGGPGVYKNGAVEIEVHDSGNSKVWLSMSGDSVTFTLDRTQESGTLDATLTNADSGKAAALRLTGTWNCKA
jgi:hypothetical protein